MVPGAFVRSCTAELAWASRAGRQITKHDVPCANEDDVEVIGTTDVAHSTDEMRRLGEMEKKKAYLSMGTSLHGSMEGRRDERPEPRLSERRRSI